MAAAAMSHRPSDDALFCDYLGVGTSPKLRKSFSKDDKNATPEVVVFSDLVTKINRKNVSQERGLVITSRAIYNVLPPDYVKPKRRIPLEAISGITTSAMSSEFVIHVAGKGEYDYRLVSARSPQIITLLWETAKPLTGRDLVVEEVHARSLWNDTMTKDRQKMNKKLGLPTEWTPGADTSAATWPAPHRASPPMDTSSDLDEGDVVLLHAGEYGGAGGGAGAGGGVSMKRRSRRMTGWTTEKAVVTTDDFEHLKILGKGTFGKVMLVKHNETGELYAMKIVRKDTIIARNQVEHTMAERKILQSVEHPFLVSLKYAFQSPTKLYFVLDYKTGGELFFHLQREGKFDEATAGFYAAEIVLGIGHLHSLGIVYRDLKPENILLDSSGHIALTDFGLCKQITTTGETKTFCGTPEYLAPEVLTEAGHGKDVDWWSLGVLLYEMVVGVPPFYSSSTSTMYELIQHGALNVPSCLSGDMADLLRKLLQRDPVARLGAGDGDAKAILAHPFFARYDTASLLSRSAAAPIQPRASKNDADTPNFDEQFTAEPVVDSVVPESALRRVVEAADSGGGGGGGRVGGADMFEGFSFAPQSGLAAAAAGAAADVDHA